MLTASEVAEGMVVRVEGRYTGFSKAKTKPRG